MILIRKTNKFKLFFVQTFQLYKIFHVLNYEILVLRKHSALNVHKFERAFRYLTHTNLEDILYIQRTKGVNNEKEISSRRSLRKTSQHGNANSKE